MNIFEAAFHHRVIYVIGIADAAHRGLLKIGMTTFHGKNIKDDAQKRVDEYTRTAGIPYKLLYSDLAVTDRGDAFDDHEVHRLLKRSGIEQKPPADTRAREWFRLDLATARAAIAAVKQGEKFLPHAAGRKIREEIIFRPEQEDAITRTVNFFAHGKEFLWNAKMRFGKTLCALEVVRRMNFAKTIIITHRPEVRAGWFDDYQKIFGDNKNFNYGSRKKGSLLDELLAGKKNFVYFASIQDLRGSETVNREKGRDKNSALFKTRWDCVIVDEAHEGTQTQLGDAVIKSLVKSKTKFLALSGTPFNLVDGFSDENTFTWGYVDEQRAKAACELVGDANPYADLPRMNIYTYNLGNVFENVAYVDVEEMAFNFREFFRTEGGSFVNEDDVKKFLDLLVKPDDNNYPYANENFRDNFRHALWVIPGVKEGRALSRLLKNHRVFGSFKIVNVAGNGDRDDESADALTKVRDAIDKYKYTITLTCGKLTAGVTVPEWTAVFYLAGGQSTSAAAYLQTIFRVQNPCKKDGRVKENCFVFDFAPDRTLRLLAEYVKVSTRPGKATDADRKTLGELLNFCPVIALDGSKMKTFDADKLFKQLKRAYIDRAVRNGFDDRILYNDELLKLDDLDLKKFDALKKIVGVHKVPKTIDINNQGFDNEQREKQPPGRPRQPVDKERLKQLQRRRDAIAILRGISIRLPLLIYGSDMPFDENFTLKKFTEIDDASWAEFMPDGVTKNFFLEFIKYYDRDIFIAAAEKIRQRAKDVDNLQPIDRAIEIAKLFDTFKNPDKETVLTPWRVVKLHLNALPKDTFAPDKKILDINAKTGLYPLLIAMKIYSKHMRIPDETRSADLYRTWDAVVAENIFVVCKTPMAEKITRRTLLGYRTGKVNAEFFPDLVGRFKNKPAEVVADIIKKFFVSKGVGTVKFDAVVGNPPYQIAVEGDNKNYASPVYHLFMDAAFKLADRVSLIHPARCLSNAGDVPKDFNCRLLADKHFKVIEHYDSQELFPTSDIKGGVVITLYDKTQTFEPIGTFFEFNEMKPIHDKIIGSKNFRPFSKIIFPPEIYHFTKKFHEDNPNAADMLSDGHADDLTTNIFEKLPRIFLNDKPSEGHEYIQIYGLIKLRRMYKWIRRDYVNSPPPLTKFKVLVPKSNGSGALGEVVSTPLVGSPLVGSPLVGSTQTFISVGAFDTRAEADACIAYIKSKFARALLGVLKVTQHNPPSTWAKVPLQNFTPTSDLDWTVPIAEIDAQLYRKYGLTDAEIEFIESHVKAMA